MIKENVGKYVIKNTTNDVDAKPKDTFFTKIKRTDIYKNIKKSGGMKLFLPIVLLIVIVFVYFALFENNGNVKKEDAIKFTSNLEYCNILEEKLVSVLGSVKGAGNVKVMVTLESGPELKIATQTDERTNTSTNSSGTTTNVTIVEEPIIVNQNGEEQPLVLMEILPVIKGVVVVAEGAKDVAVRLNLLSAVQALLGIGSDSIQILTGV